MAAPAQGQEAEAPLPLHPRSGRRPQRESQETETAWARCPSAPPEKRVGCRPTRLHAGQWGPPGGSGGLPTFVSVGY